MCFHLRHNSSLEKNVLTYYYNKLVYPQKICRTMELLIINDDRKTTIIICIYFSIYHYIQTIILLHYFFSQFFSLFRCIYLLVYYLSKNTIIHLASECIHRHWHSHQNIHQVRTCKSGYH